MDRNMNDKKRKFSRFSFPDFLFVIIFVLSSIFLEISSGSFVSNFNRFGFTILSSMTIGSQVITIDNYIKAYNEMKTKKIMEQKIKNKKETKE